MRVLTKINRLETRIKPVDRTPRDRFGNPLPVLSPARRARAEELWASVRVSDREVDWSQAPEATREEHTDVLRLLILRVHEAEEMQFERLHGQRRPSLLGA